MKSTGNAYAFFESATSAKRFYNKFFMVNIIVIINLQNFRTNLKFMMQPYLLSITQRMMIKK